MVEVGKVYSGKPWVFHGKWTPLKINQDTNELKVRLEYQGATWEETWDLQITIWALESGDYYAMS